MDYKAYYAAIVQSSDDAIYGKTLEGIINSWNKGAEKMYGYSANEIIGKSISILIPPNNTDEFPDIIGKINKGESIDHYETERITKDGHTIDVSVSISLIRDKTGEVIGAATIARDITHGKKSEQMFRALLDSAPDATIIVNEEGKIKLVNQQTLIVFGYSREEIVGKPIEILIPPEFSHNHVNHRNNFFKNAGVRRMGAGLELFAIKKDGVKFPVEISLSPLQTAEGLLVSAAVRDISKTKQASQYARSLIEASLDPLVTISPEGKITDVNQATINVTGIPSEKLIGTDFSDYFTEPDKARQGYQTVLKEGFVTDYPLTIRHVNGFLTEVLYNASTYKDVSGNVLGVFAAARDISQTKQASQYARSLIEASLDPLVTISPEGKITDVNQATIDITGISIDKLIGTDFSDYFTEPEKARQGYQQVLKDGYVTDYPLTIRHLKGSLIEVLYNASVYKDTNGEVLGVFAAARDISKTKQASEYARSLIEASLDPLVTISPEGKITDVNQATIKVTGISREKLIGTDFSDYFTEPEKAREGYQKVLKESFVTDYPLTIRHSNSQLVEVLYNATVYKDTSGKVLGVFAAARDVTAQKKAEEEVAVQRKKELIKLAELEKFQKVTVGRELKMIELKNEIEELKNKLNLLKPE